MGFPKHSSPESLCLQLFPLIHCYYPGEEEHSIILGLNLNLPVGLCLSGPFPVSLVFPCPNSLPWLDHSQPIPKNPWLLLPILSFPLGRETRKLTETWVGGISFPPVAILFQEFWQSFLGENTFVKKCLGIFHSDDSSLLLAGDKRRSFSDLHSENL